MESFVSDFEEIITEDINWNDTKDKFYNVSNSNVIATNKYYAYIKWYSKFVSTFDRVLLYNNGIHYVSNKNDPCVENKFCLLYNLNILHLQDDMYPNKIKFDKSYSVQYRSYEPDRSSKVHFVLNFLTQTHLRLSDPDFEHGGCENLLQKFLSEQVEKHVTEIKCL